MGGRAIWRWRARGPLAGALLVISAVSLAGSGALGAASGRPAVVPPPSVRVSPSTGLADLQKVTVTGAHFSAKASIGTVECRPGATGPDGCDLGTLVYVTADASGGFTLSRPVRRLIRVGTTRLDCASASGCILGAGNIANFAEAAGATIVFDPKIPPVVPTVNVLPHTGLVDHQLVVVRGKGFMPSGSASVAQCVTTPAPGAFESCDYSSQRYTKVADDGTFTLRNFALQRILSIYTRTGPSTVDCAGAPGACAIKVQGGQFGGAPVSVRLGFDPAVPPVVATLAATPRDGLADDQLVTVTGEGFTPGVAVSVLECVVQSAPFPACDYRGSRSVTAGFHGHFAVTFAVHRTIAAFTGPNGAASVDCASRVGACVLSAAGSSSQKPPSTPLAFDPRVAPAIPRIRAHPGEHLHDNQRIGVSGHGFTPFAPIVVVECSAAAAIEGDLSYCDYATAELLSTAREGRFDGSIAVHQVIGGQGGLVGCGAHPGACVLAALPGSGGFPGEAALSPSTATTLPGSNGRAGAAPLLGPSAARAAPGSVLPGVAFTPLRFGPAEPGEVDDGPTG